MARAAVLGPAQGSHGQPLPTSSDYTIPLRQLDKASLLYTPPSRHVSRPAATTAALRAQNLTFAIAPTVFTRTEHGGGSMAVATSSQHQHHVIPQDDPPVPLSPSPDQQRVPDMASATSDAPPAMPATSSDVAPADPKPNATENNVASQMPLLGDAVPLPQPGDMNGDLNGDLNGNMNGHMPATDMATAPMPMDMSTSAFPAMDPFMPPTTNERLTAFARLRFDDGSYYMHTYQITLGRNIHLAHLDMKRLIKAEALHAQGHTKAAEECLKGKKDKKKKKRERRGARSVISEKGGIVNVPIESMPMEFQQRRQSNASHSLSSASHQAGEAAEGKPAERAPQDMLMQAFPEVPAQFDGHVPEDPNDCPFVPIHPQQIMAKTGSLGPKGISREHAKIFFDFDAGHFCIHVLGNNGLHHEGEFYPKGETIPLDHGDHLLIGAVNIHFYLPDVALTEQQRNRQESGSRPMSFSFENGNGQLESDEHMSSESEDQQSVNPRHVYYHHPVSDSEDDDGLADEEMDDYEEPLPKPRQKTNLKLKIKNLPPAPSAKDSKKAHKRKPQHRELTPEEPPSKKVKIKVKDSGKSKEQARESAKEPKAHKERKEPKEQKEQKEKEPVPAKETKESKEPKEPKEPKDKGKAPAKAPTKTTVKDEAPAEQSVKDIPAVTKPEQPSKPPPNDSPPLLRKPHEGELEAGDIEGLITEEMAIQHNLPRNLIGHVVEKRKGPGRPPKDGIMSKRQRSQLIKQAKDIERARAAGIDPADIPIPTIKPKAPKRKESNAGDGDDDGVMETTEHGDGTLSGLQKQAKPMRPPRTPSPEMRIEDYTEEQLQRPTANYVVLIHEAISSSPTGQMNLQSIYTYIERKYPWYKFKTTTSGWQSSVRHNLGQHDAFMKGDKEGKGYLWRINPEVSIEKERRKRQASPPMSHAPRPQYYQPPNGYQPYPQPGYPYHPGMPHGMPQAPPRLPPSLAQPRLPPSMARGEGNTAAPNGAQNAPHPSPYASPWAGGNTSGSPSAPNPPRPYPQPNSQAPVNSAPGSSGQYGVLFPTAAPQQSPYSGPSAPSPYGGPYAATGASPYGPAPPRPYPTYPQAGQQPNAPAASPAQRNASPYGPPQTQSSSHPGSSNENSTPHPSGRYPIGVHPDLIRQLEAYRLVYLEKRPGPDEQKKVDNAIRACVDRTVPEASLTEPERKLLESICGVESINKHVKRNVGVKPESTPVAVPSTAAGTAAAIAADAAANTLTQNQQQPQSQQQPAGQAASGTTSASPAPPRENSEPQKFTPNMTGASPAPPAAAPPSTTAPAPSAVPSHRPSVEPITPVPGSPAVQTGTPLRRPMNESTTNSPARAEESTKAGETEEMSKAD